MERLNKIFEAENSVKVWKLMETKVEISDK